MKKHAANRKKKKLNPQWIHDTAFEIIPKRHLPAEPRLLKDYTILIAAREAGTPLPPATTKT